jgi:serine protease Do
MQRIGKTRKIILVVLGFIAIALLIGVFWKIPHASRRGGAGTGAPAAKEASSTSAYQPADQYESDVMAATKKASPAVVSITISENVPIVENCPIDPLSNVPQEFQQFFSDGSGFSFSFSTSTSCDTGKTKLEEVGGGSGFIISSDGLILTNKHVVSETDAQYSVLTNDGDTYVAKVLARDPNQDLAVLKINATNLSTVSLGDSDSLQLGQTAIAIGNALGQFSNTVSVGVVSGLGRTVTASSEETGEDETIKGVIQTDAAINPGNSGGPLLDLRGDVIGIDTAIASDAQSIGFAIPINEAKSVIASVEATGKIHVPYIGVRYEDVTPAIAMAQKLPITYGALVDGGGQGAAVVSDSPAATAGIKKGDIIESVNGLKLDSTHDLGSVINEYGVSSTVALVINRDGKEITLQVTLAERPAGE